MLNICGDKEFNMDKPNRFFYGYDKRRETNTICRETIGGGKRYTIIEYIASK